MPTYDYQCPQCGKFEQMQSITADPLRQCPTCGSEVKRLISNNVNIIFKGSGFYVTDNRSKSSDSAGSGAAKSAPDTASSKSESSTTPAKASSDS